MSASTVEANGADLKSTSDPCKLAVRDLQSRDHLFDLSDFRVISSSDAAYVGCTRLNVLRPVGDQVVYLHRLIEICKKAASV
jgi:hypothetical protein